jgi:hypothetical protein
MKLPHVAIFVIALAGLMLIGAVIGLAIGGQ